MKHAPSHAGRTSGREPAGFSVNSYTSADSASKRQGDSDAQRPATRQPRSKETEATQESANSALVFCCALARIRAAARQDEVAVHELENSIALPYKGSDVWQYWALSACNRSLPCASSDLQRAALAPRRGRLLRLRYDRISRKATPSNSGRFANPCACVDVVCARPQMTI
jgi:hypothetical protein